MKIEELVAGKNDHDSVQIEGIAVSVADLKKLMQDGYRHLKFYRDSKTFSLWGENCAGSFTPEQLHERASLN